MSEGFPLFHYKAFLVPCLPLSLCQTQTLNKKLLFVLIWWSSFISIVFLKVPPRHSALLTTADPSLQPGSIPTGATCGLSSAHQHCKSALGLDSTLSVLNSSAICSRFCYWSPFVWHPWRNQVILFQSVLLSVLRSVV